VTASLGVTRRRSLCRHVLLTAVWLNTTIGGSNRALPLGAWRKSRDVRQVALKIEIPGTMWRS